MAKKPTTAELRELPLDAILTSGDNTRAAPGADLEELAASIRAMGVLEPVLVRVHPMYPDKYELRAGERRWRAAKLAGLKTIPAIVREMDDLEAERVTVLENLQRQDLRPLEEGRAIARLIRGGDVSVKAIAEHLGKSPTWVARRAALTRLSPAWQKRICDPNHWSSRWSASHLVVIARQDAKDQEELLKESQYGDWMGACTAEELEREMGAHRQALKSAAWKRADGELLPDVGACAGCAKRTDTQPGLFDEWFEQGDAAALTKASKGACCLDRDCWERKLHAHVEARKAVLREKHPDLILISSGHGGTGQGVLSHYDYKAAKKGAKGARPALVVDGPSAGTLRRVKLESYVTETKVSRAATDRKPTPLKERRRKLGRRRDCLVIASVRKHLEDADRQELLDNLVGYPASGPDGLMSLAATFGTHRLWGKWKEYDELAEDKAGAEELLLSEVLRIFITDLSPVPASYEDQMKGKMEHVKGVCRIFQLDLEGYRAEAKATLPDPKSWARLKEDGTPRAAPKAKGRTRKKARKEKKA